MCKNTKGISRFFHKKIPFENFKTIDRINWYFLFYTKKAWRKGYFDW